VDVLVCTYVCVGAVCAVGIVGFGSSLFLKISNLFLKNDIIC
jgi:hypothetical protein